MFPRRLPFAAVALSLTSASLLHAQQPHWVGSWAASQQLPEPQNAIPASELHDLTLRQVVHLSLGGSSLRIHLSNAFGTSPLHLTSVHIAKPAPTGTIDPASDLALHFSGSADVLIPPGAEYISDPVDYTAAPLSDLAVSLHVDALPPGQTGHPGSRATSYLAHGDLVSATSMTGSKPVEHWYILSAIDVAARPAARQPSFSIVTLGDSITDGHGATTNGNDRWPDVLAERLQKNPATRAVGVLNQGIGGNHLLTDGLGPNVLARLDRDVLAQTAVRYLIVLEGINDLGALALSKDVTALQHQDLVHRIIGAFEQIVAQAHAHGIKVIGATILPDTGSDYYHPAPANERDRQQVNQWIITPGHFDAAVDLDKVMSDPAEPHRLLPAYDSGDHLHPSPAGYRAMAAAFPLTLFSK